MGGVRGREPPPRSAEFDSKVAPLIFHRLLAPAAPSSRSPPPSAVAELAEKMHAEIVASPFRTTIPPPLPLVTVLEKRSVSETEIPVVPPPWNERAPPTESAML